MIDQDNDLGQGTSAVLVFKNLPILATPYMQFPLGNRRRSSLCRQRMGISSTSGMDLTIPYYFNLAPNYDLTVYPGVTTKRGVKLGGEYRYMTCKYGTGCCQAITCLMTASPTAVVFTGVHNTSYRVTWEVVCGQLGWMHNVRRIIRTSTTSQPKTPMPPIAS